MFKQGSGAARAQVAALGMFQVAWFMYFAGRHAECFRSQWNHTEVDGVHDETAPPVWAVGQAGLLGQFQDAQGTGFGSIQWHCKMSSRPPSFCELNCRVVLYGLLLCCIWSVNTSNKR